ncbi:MAG: UpxY family transcription antiterminator [Bacteroidaceae bacterium]|nr:UpxY family transcription antiterminator [Bacteroidaceae bacterium]
MANWYILCTLMHHEKKVAEKLQNAGFEVYLPAHKVRRKWSDRIKVIDELVITRVVFVRCEDRERKDTFVDSGCFYMMDRASRKVAVVPDRQLDAFRQVVCQTEFKVEFFDRQLKPGMKVRINNSIFDDIDAEVSVVEGKERVFVRIDMLGCAVVEVAKDDLTPVSPLTP